MDAITVGLIGLGVLFGIVMGVRLAASVIASERGSRKHSDPAMEIEFMMSVLRALEDAKNSARSKKK